jgi:hypothetical protein
MAEDPPVNEALDAVAAGVTGNVADTNAKPPKVKRKGLVNAERLRVDPALRETRLASSTQRAGAMVVDLAVIAALSQFANPVLGLLTGATLAVLGSRRESKAKAWGVVRWFLIVVGAMVMVASGFMLAGQPLLKSGAFNLAREKEAPELSAVEVSATASSGELRRAVEVLQTQVDYLQLQNAELRDEIRGNSWMRLAADTTRTMGFTFGWAGIYFTLCTPLLRGRTVGKLIWGSRVARLDGEPLTFMDAFIRNSGYAAGLATGLIGFARLMWDPNRQAIQDRIAGTVVVRTRG